MRPALCQPNGGGRAATLPQRVPRLQRARAPLGGSEGDCPQHAVLPRTALAAALLETAPAPPSQPGTYTFSFLLTPGPPGKGSIHVSSICPSIYLSMLIYHLSMDLSIYLCVYHLSIHPSVSVWLSAYLLIHFHVCVLQLYLKLSSHVSRSSISSTSCGTYIAISEYFMKRKMIVGDLAAFEYMIEKPTVFPSYRQKNYLYICRSLMYL